MKKQQKQLEFIWDYKGVFTHLYSGDIYYVHLENRNLYVHTKSRAYPIGREINVEEGRLAQMPIVRTHYSYIIHLYHLESLKGNKITLRNGEVIPVSKSRKKRVRECIQNYFKERIC